ncbi:MAG: hypothetical protein J5501_00250 [Ruminococcus sp.]|nr:hypothetical protein [Ruminococcus sp.]
MDFIKTHMFSIVCVLFILWVIIYLRTMLKYKKNGVALTGKVVDYKIQSSNYFPVFEFDYEGQTLRVDSYEADKNNNGIGTVDTIYYLPGNTKGVFRERNLKMKLWMILGSLLCIAYIIMDFTVFHK